VGAAEECSSTTSITSLRRPFLDRRAAKRGRLPPRPFEHHQGREGKNAPARHAITNAAMTAIAATKNTTTRQISDRSAV
jgi:hypothetical protein